MKVYYDVIKFNFKEIFSYPSEVVAYFIRKSIHLGFLIIFWVVVTQDNGEIFEARKTISYFLISSAIVDITFLNGTRFGRRIQKLIKRGELSNYLLKPIDTIKYLFAGYIGRKGTVAFFAIILLTVGIYLQPPKSLLYLPLALTSIILTTLTGLGVNIIMATVGFYTPEAGSLKNVFEHTRRLLSGALIPLSYFPPLIKKLTEISFFPVLTYYPTVIVQGTEPLQSVLIMLLISAGWAVALLTLGKILWEKALKNYDGVGI
ncbi:hypothetical protein GF360_01195 [candidate division WWE3 bacterium]|nr:hypothetical protein [candidate division WWE3 bacterium]